MTVTAPSTDAATVERLRANAPDGCLKIGYARVSTTHQATDQQVAKLTAAGCSLIFHEAISSRVPAGRRPKLQRCLATLQAGDCLVVAKLDRLGRSQVEVVNRLHSLQGAGVHVKTLDGLIDTQALGLMAPLVIGLLTGLAEVERELIRERTLESVEHRRASGGNLGGRPGLPAAKVAHVVALRKQGKTYEVIAKEAGVSRGAITRILSQAMAKAD